MKLKKEVILIIIILISIIILDFVTNYISEKSVKEIMAKLDEISILIETAKYQNNQNELSSETEKNLEEKVSNLKNEWNNKQNKLSMFVEHDELEKVTINIVLLEENIKNLEFVNAQENEAEVKYWLNHFKEKEKLNLKNIF